MNWFGTVIIHLLIRAFFPHQNDQLEVDEEVAEEDEEDDSSLVVVVNDDDDGSDDDDDDDDDDGAADAVPVGATVEGKPPPSPMLDRPPKGDRAAKTEETPVPLLEADVEAEEVETEEEGSFPTPAPVPAADRNEGNALGLRVPTILPGPPGATGTGSRS